MSCSLIKNVVTLTCILSFFVLKILPNFLLLVLIRFLVLQVSISMGLLSEDVETAETRDVLLAVSAWDYCCYER